jgi:DNA primase
VKELVERVLKYYRLDYTFDGEDFKLRCPLHDERTPSFGIKAEDGRWYCFGCRRGGGIMAFIEAMSMNSFEAYMTLSRIRRGLDVDLAAGKVRPDDNERRRKRRLSDEELLATWRRFHAVDWLTISGAHPVMRYMERRGFTRETLQGFDVRLSESAEYPVVLPILMGDKFVGFVKRRIDDVEVKKYLYNDGFSASRSMAYARTGKADLLVVEGMLDYMKAAQFGYKHIAALLSWRATDEQILWLQSRKIKRLISALDNTPTGEEGTSRLHEFFEVKRFVFPGRHRKDVGDVDVAQFWMGVMKAKDYTEARRASSV